MGGGSFWEEALWGEFLFFAFVPFLGADCCTRRITPRIFVHLNAPSFFPMVRMLELLNTPLPFPMARMKKFSYQINEH